MANGIPVRLSEGLTTRARTAAETADRSLTEQVEHWARLGQAVEDAVLAATVQKLKARTHDPELAQRLGVASTPAGRAKAVAFIQQRNQVMHGIGEGGRLRVVRSAKKRAKK
jgi:ABC-type hemin transport system substrate-binding protein